MAEKIYLVTGAAGFLGMNICKNLLQKKENVRALVLSGDKAVNYLPKEAEVVFGNILDAASMEAFFDVPNDYEIIVIHTASIVALSPEKNQKVYDVNVKGTKNIIDFCVKKKVKRLVYISSTGAITEQAKKKIIREPDSFEPEKLVGYYSETKALATKAVFDAVKRKGLNASVVYPSGICGPDDYACGPFVQFVSQYCNGEMPAGIQGSFNSVDVRDLAEGVIACAEKGKNGEGYIMSNEMVSIREIFDLMSSLSGAKRVKKIIPVRAAKLIAFFSGIISKMKKKPPMMTNFQIYNLARNNHFDCSKAKKELDYTVRPFTDTMADTIDWLMREGKINVNYGQ